MFLCFINFLYKYSIVFLLKLFYDFLKGCLIILYFIIIETGNINPNSITEYRSDLNFILSVQIKTHEMMQNKDQVRLNYIIPS